MSNIRRRMQAGIQPNDSRHVYTSLTDAAIDSKVLDMQTISHQISLSYYRCKPLIHCCVDIYSRLMVYRKSADNNQADSGLYECYEAVQQYRLSSSVSYGAIVVLRTLMYPTT